MKITVITTMPPGVYSGGRYLSLVLAHSVSRAGAEVTYVTNTPPIFERDFKCYETIAPIRTIVTADFALPADLETDWVVVIPTGGLDRKFYSAAVNQARKQNARIALLCFETPNWYAALSPFPRTPMPTELWRQVVAAGGLIVSIAREGMEPARTYFGPGLATLPLRVAYWHPALNDLAAAAVPPTALDGRRKVVMFVRTEDPHKGAQDLLRLPPQLFEKHVLSLIFGRAVNADYVAAVRRHFSHAQDFAVEILTRITDEEKFKLLSEACLLLFPSYFEGYGYPPVEAAWMGVPTVAYDLPLLREVAGEAVWFAPRGDVDAFADLVRRSLAERRPGPNISALMKVQTDTLTAGHNFLSMLNAAMPYLPPVGSPPALYSTAGLLPGLNASARAIAAHSADGVTLFEPAAVMVKGQVTVTGVLRGLEHNARLEIDLPSGGQIQLKVNANGERPKPFIARGILGSWPALKGQMELPIRVVFNTGRRVELGSVSLVPDDIALLSDSADGGQLAPNDTLVIADLGKLVAKPWLAAAVCELISIVERRGGRTALICPPGAKVSVSTDDLNVLPRFAAVVVLDKGALRDIATKAYAEGRLILVTPDLQSQVALDAASHLRLELGASDALLAVSLHLQGSSSQVICSDARRWGRLATESSRQPAFVLLPPSPIVPFETALARMLRQIRFLIGGARFLVPKELASNRDILSQGQIRLTQIARAELHQLLSQETVVGIRIGAGTERPDVADLFDLYDRPVLSLDLSTGSVQPVLDWYLTLTEARAGSLGAALTPLLVLPGRPKLQFRTHVGYPVGRASGDGIPIVPVNGVLSLSGTLGGISTALLDGWAQVTKEGAQLRDSESFLAFRLPAHGQKPSSLDLMIEVKGKNTVGLKIEVMLNDHDLGFLSKLRAGAGIYHLEPPAAAWSCGQQMLRLYCRSIGHEHAEVSVTLMAISPREAPCKGMDFAVIEPTAARLAPLYANRLTETPAIQTMYFHSGAASGFVRLISGWSHPEPTHVWSDSRQAMIAFSPELFSPSPLLLTFKGHCFAPSPEPGAAGQRLLIRYGSCLLAEAVLPVVPAAVVIPIPQSLIGRGLNYLALEFPDAISPRQVGLSDDVRQLGFALTAVRAVAMSQPIQRLRLVPSGGQREWSLRLDLSLAPCILRLVGAGPLPDGARFLLVGSGTGIAPLALLDGGWEALIGIEPEKLSGNQIAIVCSCACDDTPLLLEALEVWSPASPDNRYDSKPIELLLLDRTGAHEDLRDLLAHDFMSEIDARMQPLLPLPIAFSFHGEAPRTDILERGWSRPEEMATRSVADEAVLLLPKSIGSAIITLEAAGFLGTACVRQRVQLSSRGHTFATLFLNRSDFAALHIFLPEPFIPADRIVINLLDATTPKSVDPEEEGRQHALFLRSLSLTACSGSLPMEPSMTWATGGAVGMVAVTVCKTEGLFLVSLRGRAEIPLGVAQLIPAGNIVVTHAFPASEGWEAILAIAPDQLDPDGQCLLRLIYTEADLEGESNAHILCLQPTSNE